MEELSLVESFHIKYKIPIVDATSQVSQERIDLRITLLGEEIKELIEADALDDIVEVGKESSDVYYVILGTALELGYGTVFKNMTAFDNHAPQLSRSNSLQQVEAAYEIFKNNWSKENSMTLLRVLEDYIASMGLKNVFSQIFEEVHRSNMSKGTNGKPLIREDGKVLKGADFSPANLSFLNRM